VLLSAAEIYFSVSALMQPDVLGRCSLPGGTYGGQIGIVNWLYAQFGLACLHLMFAPYIQHQLWRKLHEEAQEQEEEDQNGVLDLTRARVKESFKHVFLYDMGVCLYILSLPASFAWSFLGAGWVDWDAACNPEGFASWAAGLGMVFVWAVVLYTAVWYCYLSCMTSMQLHGGRWGGGSAGQRFDTRHGGSPGGKRGRPGKHRSSKGYSAELEGGFAGGSVHADNGADKPVCAGAPLRPGRSGDCGGANMQPGLTGMQRACQLSQLVKLVACLGLDLFGNASYLLPGLGEGIDLAYAPAQAIALKMMFHSNFIAVFGFIEELLPFTDIIPTATIAWCLETFAHDHAFTRMIGLGDVPDASQRRMPRVPAPSTSPTSAVLPPACGGS